MDKELVRIVSDLIAKGIEGDYWDFKQEHHKDNSDLVRDIICLANNPHCEEDRYLIFGVDDKCNVVGLVGNTKSQAEIIDTLRNAKFSGTAFPRIFLKKIQIDGKDIETPVRS